MPNNSCSLPPMLPANARDVEVGNFVGDNTDEFVYIVSSTEPKGPTVRLFITFKATNSDGSCTWKNVVLHEQNLSEMGVKYTGGGWGSPGTISYSGYKYSLADFDGDGKKDIQIYKADKGKLTPIYYIPNLMEYVREKLAHESKRAL